MQLTLAQGQIEITDTLVTFRIGGIALSLPMTTSERRQVATALLQIETSHE